MKEKFTLVWSFRNRPDVLTNSIVSADRTCRKEVDFCLVDAASNEETIRRLRVFCNIIEGRVVRVCESTYRSSLAEAWNLGMMLTDNRYVMFASSDVMFLRRGWHEAFVNCIFERGGQYILMPNHAVFCFDKKAISRMGWFDERFKAGPHFDPDFMIRASESGVKLEVIQNEGFYTHGEERDAERERRTGAVADRLPMHDLTNELIFKSKWQSEWPGWGEAIKRGDEHLPHPPTNISQVKRLVPEIDPHPVYTQKYAAEFADEQSGSPVSDKVDFLTNFLKKELWSKKYMFEEFRMLPGLYNHLDGRILYSIVRELKPRTIIDIGPREGRTTSCIVNALTRNIGEGYNQPIEYYLFEMDMPYLDNIKEYLKSFPGVSFHINTNVIESDVLNKISAVDLLFIDANHDYILARWYIQNLFGLLNKNSVIHLHDMHYNKTGKGWHDITFEGSPQDHPDIVDTDVLRQLYPTIFDEYFMGQTSVNRYEGDEVADFYKNNEDKLSFFSTTSLARQLGVYKPNTEGMVIPEPCSLYFYVKDPASLVTGHNFEDREKGYCENTFART